MDLTEANSVPVCVVFLLIASRNLKTKKHYSAYVKHCIAVNKDREPEKHDNVCLWYCTQVIRSSVFVAERHSQQSS